LEGNNNMDQHRNDIPHDLLHEGDPAAAGLTLVERAAELIRTTEDNAAEIVARAETAVAHMQEEMRLGERVLEAAETRRRVAEAEAKDLKSKLEKSEKTYQQRIEALTAELQAALKRGDEAEARAEEASRALDRIQSAMQGILKVRGPADTDQTPDA
jgi:chromosome segregation ATPase